MFIYYSIEEYVVPGYVRDKIVSMSCNLLTAMYCSKYMQ